MTSTPRPHPATGPRLLASPAGRAVRTGASTLGRGLLWIAAGIFLLQAIFHFLQLQRVNAELYQKLLRQRAQEQALADWRQKAAYATSPEFLDSAVKEFTLTRDPEEIEIIVEPSPVPPVGDIR